MKAALNLIGELDEQTIRDVHSGDIPRSSLKSLAQEKGFPQTAGKSAHRLIRAHENLEAFIAFYVAGVSHAMDAADAPEVEGNVANVTVKYPHGRPVRGLERLMRDHEMAPEEWEVDSMTVNEWPTTMGADEGGVIYVNNFQAKARLSRKERTPKYERVQPVSVEAPDAPNVTPMELDRPDGWKTALIYGDPQYGFRWRPQGAGLIPLHDRDAIDLLVQVAALVKPETLVNLGDLFDFAPLKDLNDKPELKRALQPALCEAGYDQARLRAAAEPDEHIVHEGNHDVRLQDKLLADLTEIYQLRDVEAQKHGGPPAASIPSLLKMDEKGIEWSEPYKDDERLLNDGLATMHGNTAKSDSGDTTRYTLKYDVSDYSKVFGHIHRQEWAWQTKWKGGQRREIGAGSPGALCRVDGVVPAVRQRMNYQQGLMLVHYDPNGWEHVVDTIRIWPDTTEGPSECWLRGKRLQADPPSAETLSDATGFDFT
jgi:hypothetical protein